MATNETALPTPIEQQPKEKKHASQRTRRIVADVIVYTILTIMAIVWVLPIVWILLQSFTGQQIDSQKMWVPEIWDFEVVKGNRIEYGGRILTFKYTLGAFGNYRQLFTNEIFDKSQTNQLTDSNYNFFATFKDGQIYPGGFMNTLLLSVFCAIFSTLLTLMTSYAFSRLRFKGRQGMMRIIMILGMFPGFLGLIILYQFFYKVLGVDTDGYNLWILVVIYSGGAGMGYYISKGFFDTISKQIDEAAEIDGATRFQIFYKITLPLSKPIIVYQILTSFMGPWAEFITAGYLLRSPQNYENGNPTTVAVQLQNMLGIQDGMRGRYWGQFAAGAVLVAIPTSILFIIMQKNYVSGVTGGAVQGSSPSHNDETRQTGSLVCLCLKGDL